MLCHVNCPWFFPLFKLKGNNFITKYFNERIAMLELLGDLKITGGFHLNLVGGLAKYNGGFKVQDAIILASISTLRFRISRFYHPT
jgi:hypothetical protein